MLPSFPSTEPMIAREEGMNPVGLPAKWAAQGSARRGQRPCLTTTARRRSAFPFH